MTPDAIHTVTGVFGYSGKYITRRLLDEGRKVTEGNLSSLFKAFRSLDLFRLLFKASLFKVPRSINLFRLSEEQSLFETPLATFKVFALPRRTKSPGKQK